MYTGAKKLTSSASASTDEPSELLCFAPQRVHLRLSQSTASASIEDEVELARQLFEASCFILLLPDEALWYIFR